MRKIIPLKERILKHIAIRDNGCWEWTGQLHKASNFYYGEMKIDHKHKKAHRVSYEVFVGAIPTEYLVYHKCDNTICVNPDHLFVGTNRDNFDDMVKKGRGNVKLSLEKAKEIRSLLQSGVSGVEIAKRYGVVPKLISLIKHNQRWSL